METGAISECGNLDAQAVRAGCRLPLRRGPAPDRPQIQTIPARKGLTP